MEDSKLVWYNSVDIFHGRRGNNYKDFEHLPGFNNFRHMFSFFAANFSSTDRTHAIKFPIKTEVLPQCELPEFKTIDASFEELCNTRARQLLDHAIATDRKLAILYSGGIDSTLIMVSLLKVATPEELRNHTVCVLSNISIAEKRNFFNDHIMKKVPVESSYLFYAFLGNDKYIIVSGEGGDQLFGSAVIDAMFKNRGPEFVFSKPTNDKIVELFNAKVKNLEAAQKIASVLDKLIAAAPVKIDTIYKYFWWIKWCSNEL